MAQLLKGSTKLRSISQRFKYIFLLVTVFGGSFLLISINNGVEILFISNDRSISSLDDNHYETERDTSFTIKTEGCTIPGLTPLDETIKAFIRFPMELKACPNANHSILKNNATHIWLDVEILPNYSIHIVRNFTCFYEPFFRPDSIMDVYSEYADDRVEYENRVQFFNCIEAKHEFVKVTCNYKGRDIYQQFFIFAREKPLMSHKKQDKVSEVINKNSTSYYNVIVMGIDAISRLNFYRTMPRTVAYLKRKQAIELLGYNKVGDNTFPNLTPLLLGIKETDLKKTCWFDDNANFDNCPFIWQWFKEAGFYTALGEDSSSLGTFNFAKMGFLKTPTDYYTHTFFNEAEKTVGLNKDYNSYLCMGEKYFYKVLLDYIQDLTLLLRNHKLFGFFWEITMSHDYLNYPMVMDEYYEAFFKKLDSFNYLENTVLVLLSDHGIRWGGIRLTKQGRLEERLPFVHILLPTSFKNKYQLAYNNMRQNSRRLTTPFDIYATLTDLINLDQITDENIIRRTNTSYYSNRSISLFLPVPSNRTCETANIDDHWCTCHKNKKISVKSNIAYKVAQELVNQINLILKEHGQCEELHLDNIVEVTEMLAGEPYKGEVGWREFLSVVRTSPGGGMFEGTLRTLNDVWTPAGTISRLNLYGDQSKCVNHYQAKLYCYCKKSYHNQNN